MKTPEITVIDYGVGNLLSVSRGLEHCGAKVNLSSDYDYILKSQKAKILELPFTERIRKTGESKTTGGNISYLIKLFYYFYTFLKIIIIKNLHLKKKIPT